VAADETLAGWERKTHRAEHSAVALNGSSENERFTAVVLLGPTGAGKTPLGDALEARGLAGSRCVHFDFGENLRRVVASGRPDAVVSAADIEFLRGVLETGALLEDRDFPLAERVLWRFLAERQADSRTWIALNGLPRHGGQAAALADIVAVRAVVFLECSAETVRARIAANAGGDRADRRDDGIEAVRRKLALFAERTLPLLDFYRDRGVRIVRLGVSAAMTAEEMRQAVETAFCQLPPSQPVLHSGPLA
jgi:adenylate kinase